MCFRGLGAASEDAADVVVLPPSSGSPLPAEIIVDIDDEFFYKNFIDTSSDDESDDDLLTEVALLIHEHNIAQIHVYRGSFRGARQPPWTGSYKLGHSEGCTVILEAVASHDTWIWHSFFEMAVSHNEINVLQRSPVFDRLAHGQSPDVGF
ncbi:hypothetical protein QYE76_030588 [Lolium multiflorum]|uniref:Uncharacterized protein n=1 Tax=Lolium multiflorum TaxID=4521 RepID=A0AAD8QQ35_LOLMU|nr:hypothetical protein QYE76_030588 [Lolium multiflorum]